MRVFLDTNVLISAVIGRGLCRDLLKTAVEEHEVVVSQLVVDEFEAVLREKFGATQRSLDKALMLLDDLEVIENPVAKFEVDALEANDELIISAALKARADVLVTGDHEMLARGLDLPIDVVSPRGFIERASRPESYPNLADRDDEPIVSESPSDTIGARAFEFALSIVKLSRMLDEQGPDVIVRQLLRAGTSVGANIDGSAAAQSRKDRLIRMSAASNDAREANYWLRLLDQAGIAPGIDFSPYLDSSSELIRLLTSVIGNYEGCLETHDLLSSLAEAEADAAAGRIASVDEVLGDD